MNRYQNGLIYKLVCNDTSVTDCYIGSCCNFNRRKAAHKSCCNNEKSKEYNLKRYKFIREHGSWSNWSMIQIKSFPCDNKRELEAEERLQLEINGGSLNSYIPTRTKKQYHQDNKEHIEEWQKEYYQKNKEKIADYKEEYYQKNKEKKAEKITCECGSIVSNSNLKRHQQSKKHKKDINIKK